MTSKEPEITSGPTPDDKSKGTESAPGGVTVEADQEPALDSKPFSQRLTEVAKAFLPMGFIAFGTGLQSCAVVRNSTFSATALSPWRGWRLPQRLQWHPGCGSCGWLEYWC